ncbi:hypothetical protein Q7P35_012238 [Cladosporium inversicolor]
MEQAQAGCGLQDVPAVHALPNGHVNGTSGSMPEKEITYNPARQHASGKKSRTSRSNGGVEDIALCASPAAFQARKHKKHPEKESIGGMLCKAMVDHQLGISLNLLLLGALTYLLFPTLRERVGAFFTLQYQTATPGEYLIGPRDIYFVAGYVVFFTAMRAACLDYVLLPFAGMLGIKQKKTKVRFAEQAYLLLYYIAYWSWGLMVFIQDTPESTATTFLGQANDLLISLWRDYPRLLLGPSLKLYYLSQTAFWVQQIFVINIEERRKDHWQMFTHHIVTVALLVFSYGYRQMRAGNAVLVLMDVVDLIFPLAKMLKYAGCQQACDAAFALFVITWFAARHIGYLSICWSIYAHVATVTMPYGTYSTLDSARLSTDGGHGMLDNLLQPLLNPTAKTVAFNSEIRSLFLGLLGGLQVITIAWFVMIIRVVAKVLQGHPADDSRSDDEGEEDEAEEDIDSDDEMQVSSTQHEVGIPYKLRADSQATAGAERKFIEVTASSEDLKFTSSSSSKTGSKRKGKGGISSGLHLGEHKDILNRIGCLSDEQLAREKELRAGKNDARRK